MNLLKGCGADSIIMPKKEFVAEHKRLLSILKKGDKKELKKEYEEQSAELNSYLKKRKIK